MVEGLTEQAERLLVSEPMIANLATCRDGRPHVAPLWYNVAEDHLEIATTGRKLANIRANPRVSLSVQQAEEGSPVWGVSVQGTASVVEDTDRDRAIIRRINRRYGTDEDAWMENRAVVIDVGSSTAWEY